MANQTAKQEVYVVSKDDKGYLLLTNVHTGEIMEYCKKGIKGMTRQEWVPLVLNGKLNARAQYELEVPDGIKVVSEEDYAKYGEQAQDYDVVFRA